MLKNGLSVIQSAKKQNWDNYYKLHKEQIKQQHRDTNSEQYLKHKERITRKVKEYRKNNPAKTNALSKKYKCNKKHRTPKWLTKQHYNDILEFYIKADKLTKETGIKHDVDHIIPLQGKNVSGLHVPWNLQVLTSSENRKKSNKIKDYK